MSSVERVSTERELPASFGERLRALRTARGLTQRDLAGEGLSSSYLSRLESGQRMPTSKVVEQLAARLGVSADSFAGLNNGARTGGGAFLAGAVRVFDHLLAGRTAAALEVLDDLRPHLRDPDARWLVEYAAAACASRLGRTNEVFQRLSDIEPMYRGLPGTAKALGSMLQATAARELGRNREAIELGQRAVAEADALEAESDLAAEQVILLRVRSRTTLAAGLTVAGRLEEVFETSEEAIKMIKQYERSDAQDSRTSHLTDELSVVSHWTYAVALARHGEVEAAGRHLAEALGADKDVIGFELWCRVRLAVVSLFLEAGVPSENPPEVLLNEVAAVRHAARGQLDAQIFTLRAELALRAGDIEAALEHAQAALESGMLGSADRIRTLMTVVKVSTDLGLEERRLSALDELLAHLDTADPEEVRPALLKEVAALSVRTLRNHHGRS
ncbi:helix-turn-helix domain-containing protein [Crossiella sp. CA198]|uniref:helix-turn-helix domain-containing protein n=1 Tax=Crossiella sp. CA198 TaxID=3455607 RepID=UPI003F8D7C2F